MRITLQIENVDRLENGGQLHFSCADRGFDIGRHEHLDWSLPDPNRVISGKHCEVRYEGGQFVLYDCSTNGTFLNGSPTRMDRAHALRAGDKLMIGDYIIAVSLENASAAVGAGSSAAASQPWDAPAPSFASGGPAWPSQSGPSPSAQSSYPIDSAPSGPWAASPGMEGRHAPPSGAPGVGTPADDVWSQQGHGWGTADPSLYDPGSQYAEREAARPARADPLDHLADQPFLQQPDTAPPPADFGTAGGGVSASPFPQSSNAGSGGSPAGSGGEGAEPLFQMPDFGNSGETPDTAETHSKPQPVAASPFPDDQVWGVPDGDLAPSAPAAEQPPANEKAAPAPLPEAVSASAALASVAEEPAAVAPPAVASPAEQPAAAATGVNFLKAFAEGAGIPESILAGRDQEEFAREVGAMLQGITGDLMGLLQARSQVKAMTRNANRTLIARSGNNALKFSPTPQMALQTMLAPGAEENGYLPLPKAMQAAFKDIQKHHVWTYSAMQKAAARFEEKLSPKSIEAAGQVEKSTFGNHKAKLWDRLQERWTSLSGAYDDGVVGLFTQYFTEGYEELSGDDPEQNAGRMN
ncbi:type VI secretion system-associated FHA domain protein TagH [Roseibium sp. M-1]